MNRYISKIQINDLFHLHGIQISIADDSAPHLILTGKNGSGKTVLLNAVAEFLDNIKEDAGLSFLEYPKWLKSAEEEMLKYQQGTPEYLKAQSRFNDNHEKCRELYGKVDISFAQGYGFINDYQAGSFIIAFYKAARKTEIIEPKSPTKPTLSVGGKAQDNLTAQLLNFLSDLKIQEALSRNENATEAADNIKEWFNRFENILRGFFEDPNLEIQFNYKDYTFKICTGGKSFKFTELSDGFVAILEIVADLILKMQTGGNLTTEFSKPGIVLIDEIETHLHLKLQKVMLPMLTTLFPNIQFIVTTHSPFVLSSLSNATAFDLEHQEPISKLTDYSYQALAEGYFGVSSDSDYARKRLEELEALLTKDCLSDAERIVAKQIIEDYRKIPEATSPELVGAYRQLEISYYDKIRAIES